MPTFNVKAGPPQAATSFVIRFGKAGYMPCPESLPPTFLEMKDEPKSDPRRPIFDRGDFRGLGDQADAAKRLYSARAALCFSSLPSPAFFRSRLDRPLREPPS